MIEHIVLVKLANAITEEEKANLIEKSMKLKEGIPGIIDIQQGFTFSERSQGYEYGVKIRFENKSALEAFGSHPKHVEVISSLQKLGVEDTIVVDFEIE